MSDYRELYHNRLEGLKYIGSLQTRREHCSGKYQYFQKKSCIF